MTSADSSWSDTNQELAAVKNEMANTNNHPSDEIERSDHSIEGSSDAGTDLNPTEELDTDGSIDETGRISVDAGLEIAEGAAAASIESSIFDSDKESPDHIGRYQIERQLGKGGFGRVYLATDTDLQRHVAIKVPHKYRVERESDVERFLDEARTLASLDHPGVVPIYDFDRVEDRCYVVSKYIDGETLRQRMRRSALSIDEAFRLLLSVARTLHFIHDAGIVHRDIKPANLLLDQYSNCFVTDFGLALRDTSYAKERGRIGTVAYMSPEQARGEGHLVDGRSDLFGLGIIMYEMLSGELPFVGANWQEVVGKICDHEPRSLREINSKIPKEVERICQKLLSKRAAARYPDAGELADDLEYFLDHAGGPKIDVGTTSQAASRSTIESQDQLVGIIPRGLRSFDQEDASYFHELLPGARHRDGLPDSLHFWQRRMESNDPIEAFRVGVIYGSSGSGKSSFVKAGLLPTLSARIVSFAFEASGDHTEKQLLTGLRTRCPDIPVDLGLIESLSWLRRRMDEQGGRKVLIVIDQFEQWLHVHGNEGGTELSVALRQCDGRHLQCLLLVRDDFWMGVSRFADELEVDLVRSRNLAMVDLFDRRHARKVLAEYGRGYARLPDNLSLLTSSQNQFLDRAVEGLAEEGKIIPVQLVTFAEIMKGRDWDAKSLQDLGGIEGVGIRFLEESLGDSAPVETRVHQQALTAVLKSLLPEAGTNIKGAMRSESELKEISGYESEPRRLAQMISILDTDLRLITPTDPDGSEHTIDATRERYYQLTHDFLVPAVRQWLERRQQLTFRGRAAMRLSDRADVWTSRPENRHLPSWIEWVLFLFLTRSSRWDGNERRMMAASTKKHVIGSSIVGAIVLVFALMGYHFWGRTMTEGLAQQLATADTSEVRGLLDRLDKYQWWSRSPIEQLRQSVAPDSSAGLHAMLAELRRRPNEKGTLQTIARRATRSSFAELGLIRSELSSHRNDENLRGIWWEMLLDESEEGLQRFGAALMLMKHDPPPTPAPRADSDRQAPSFAESDLGEATLGEPAERWESVRSFLVNELIEQANKNRSGYSDIVSLLADSRDYFQAGLREVFQFHESTLKRQMAVSLIIDLWRDEPEFIADVFLDAEPSQMEDFLTYLDEAGVSKVEPLLSDTIGVYPDESASGQEQQRVANRQVNAAAFLMRHRSAQACWDLFRYSSIPNTRTGLIERSPRLGCDPELVLDQFSRATDPDLRSALLLMMGTFDSESISDDVRVRALAIARDEFSSSHDVGIHSAAEWMLRRFGDEPWLAETKPGLSENDVGTSRAGRKKSWSINGQGQTFLRVESPHSAFQISANEVTTQQYQVFNPNKKVRLDRVVSLRSPVILVDWYSAVEYCQWLTLQDGLGESEQCYVKSEDPNEGWTLKEDYVQRLGYRLPTSQEWESAAFSMATTRFPTGYDSSVVQEYGWTLNPGSQLKAQPVGHKKPLPSGLFGMLGNVVEWCHNWDEGGTKIRAVRGPRLNAAVGDVERLLRQGGYQPNNRFFSLGFRIVRGVPQKVDPQSASR